ncbi:histone H1 [Dictyostelium discoideum AX4]|uniref:Histone H1 n=1 Tax=Dictyostelium discoideum TaxID=44689 RepID=H1_DICDI|nr:histone H1 [Dictyostelium discoideum AX4]P54671.3 RecName: Full=Histone H1 [Dictyostelium discoideum]AAA67370.1 histone H1 [Dictyostelium discoideum]AAA93483.2 histone H1 [Dictyostelium discoideum]EAL64734.1 histone H1 [Dictyostelium discoideum AX4]|eukprot:XP_638256.1 histone H1 [Dictyostelium discoideum AX4]
MGPKAPTTPTKKAAATKSKPKPNHPTYQVMISTAIAHYKDRTGSSQPAIIKYIEANYNVAPDTFKTQLKLALKRLVAKGTLTMVKASYKLSEEGKKEHQATLGPVAKKPKAKTTATSTETTAAPPATPTKKAAPKKPAAKAASTSTKTAAAKKNSAKVTKAVSKKPAAKKAPSKKVAAKK